MHKSFASRLVKLLLKHVAYYKEPLKKIGTNQKKNQ